jgi:hypothetical protein
LCEQNDREIAEEEEVLKPNTRSYDFNPSNEKMIDDLEDTEDTRKFYHFKKHHLRQLADAL